MFVQISFKNSSYNTLIVKFVTFFILFRMLSTGKIWEDKVYNANLDNVTSWQSCYLNYFRRPSMSAEITQQKKFIWRLDSLILYYYQFPYQTVYIRNAALKVELRESSSGN